MVRRIPYTKSNVNGLRIANLAQKWQNDRGVLLMGSTTSKQYLILVTLILWAICALCAETFQQDGLWADETWSL